MLNDKIKALSSKHGEISAATLHLAAMLFMLMDHLWATLLPAQDWLTCIGRIAFPIFAFQISEGYVHTKNFKKYLLRLFVFALVSQIPFMLFKSIFTNSFGINIFGTLFFGLLSIFLYDKFSNVNSKSKFGSFVMKIFAVLPAILLGIIAQICSFDYGFWGVAIILLFYIFRNDKPGIVIFFTTACIIKYGISIFTYGYHYLYILLCLGTILPVVPICLYNGKQGKKIKYLLYAFYPVHLLILYFIFK